LSVVKVAPGSREGRLLFDPLCETGYIRDQFTYADVGSEAGVGFRPRVTGDSASIEKARA